MRTLICPTCRKSVRYDDPAEVPDRPFCSERCRLVDLGKWFSEQYRILTPVEPGTPGEARDEPGPPEG